MNVIFIWLYHKFLLIQWCWCFLPFPWSSSSSSAFMTRLWCYHISSQADTLFLTSSCYHFFHLSQITCFVFHCIRFEVPYEVIFVFILVTYENSVFLLFKDNWGFRRFSFMWDLVGVSKHQRCCLRLSLIWWVSWVYGWLIVVVRWIFMWVVIVVKGRFGKLLIFLKVCWWKPIELLAYKG